MSDALPADLAAQVEEALVRARVPGARIVSVRALGGGCVNRATRIETEGGERFFLKWNPAAPPRMFTAEAEGLEALRRDGPIRVPAVMGFGSGSDGPGWLLLEYVQAGAPGPRYGEELGGGLAELHRPAAGGWGWEHDNFIGPLPQVNRPVPRWGAFWRDCRLLPQLRRAREKGHFRGAGARLIQRVVDHAEELLEGIGDDGPSLLHGDLWSGNVFADGAGRPVLIDPAAYRGHREVDLAMSELFGGFPPGWHRTYEEARPLEPGYRERRRSLYQLYYLLVHVNLFGAGYEAASVKAAREALA